MDIHSSKQVLRVTVALAALSMGTSIIHAAMLKTALHASRWAIYTNRWAVTAVFVSFLLLNFATISNFLLLLYACVMRNWSVLPYILLGLGMGIVSIIATIGIDGATLVYMT